MPSAPPGSNRGSSSRFGTWAGPRGEGCASRSSVESARTSIPATSGTSSAPTSRGGAVAEQEQFVEVEGRTLRLRNLDKVLYPSTGTTKGEVLHYLTGVSHLLLPHLADRPVTRKRWPDGVSGGTFFEKNVPQGAPEWLRRVKLPAPGSTKDREEVTYP